MRTIIIGGGPAGLLAAITAASNGQKVTLLEKMNECGRKLLITGKGRCNITSSIEIEEFIKNIPGNGKFLYSAFQNYTNKDILQLLKEEGVNVKVERGNRIFPVSDKSIEVRDALVKRAKRVGVKIYTKSKVTKILTKNEKVIGIVYENEQGEKLELQCEKVVIATGGKSYPATGSNGEGYQLAKQLGHTITKIQPSLVPLEIEEKKLCQELQGLSLKNVQIKIKDKSKDKLIYEDFGEMIFTHFGVSGPTILSSSAHLLRYKGVDEKFAQNGIKLQIDLKPALTEEKLDLRIRRDFEELKNKQLKNSLDNLLPNKLISPIIEVSNISPEKKVNEITKQERINLVRLLKNFEFIIKGFRPIDEAIITAGGIDIKEINPKTMESKKVNGLYFAGEIIDVDAYTGGFNLQIAYSTGHAAGSNEEK